MLISYTVCECNGKKGLLMRGRRIKVSLWEPESAFVMMLRQK